MHIHAAPIAAPAAVWSGPLAVPAAAAPRPVDAMRALEPLGVVRYCRRDAGLYAEGDAAEHWFKVVSGAVRTVRLMADGRRQLGAILLPGDYFGFEGTAVRLFGAEAVAEGTVVIAYPRLRVEGLAESDPRLGRRCRELAFDGLVRAQERLVLLGRKTAVERVASFLLEMDERGAGDGGAIDLPVSRQDMADYLGLTVETVSRALAELKRRGAIALPSPQHVELRDRSHLQTLDGRAA